MTFRPCDKGTEASFYYQECTPCQPGKFDADEARYEREILPGAEEYPIVCDACDIGLYQENYGTNNSSLAPMWYPGTGSCTRVQRRPVLAMSCHGGPHPKEGVSAH